MKYACLFFLILPTLAMCQTEGVDQEPQLTEEQQKAFNQQKLSIEPEGVSFNSFGLGIYSISTWRRWTAYKGFSPLSEHEFFSITGYEAEAQKAKVYRSTNNSLIVMGAGLGIAGTVATVIGAMNTTTRHYDYGYGVEGDIEEADPDEGLIIGGLIASAVGTGLLYAGIIGLSKNWAPYATVEGIADGYNRKLLISIRKEF